MRYFYTRFSPSVAGYFTIMDILLRDKLKRGGFEGVREYRLVFDDRIADGRPTAGAWQGFGNLVYLADARLLPHGETRLHEHREIDVISVMLEGRLAHEGSLEHGKSLAAYDVQVQRGGAEGFSHNEINPDDTENRLIQLWVLPDHRGEAAGYCCFRSEPGRVTRVYGGSREQAITIPARTCIDVTRLNGGQTVDIDKPALVYLCEGRGFANEDSVADGTLMRCDQLTFDATENACLIIVHEDDT
jgi:redox-sensitive bicupin YhaK (pirin superfamily)